MSKPSDSGRTVTFTVPNHLFDAFNETANDFFATAHEGTTPAQRAAEIRAQDKDAGVDSLATLLDVAQGDAGQAGVIARFLAGLYNGADFPFDLTELRGLDDDLFEHCLAVLRLDHRPAVEVHNYFPGGAVRWQTMINQWGIGARNTAPPTADAGIGSQTYEAEYVAYSDAPGYRDVTLFVALHIESHTEKALGFHLSADHCARLAEDLLSVHRDAWDRESGMALDASDTETRPSWLRLTRIA
ncbi:MULTISPECIES: hypothetical protein [Burkholderiaceae]|nr:MULTISPECIES: hypothetical protein [Burkholderiaceae]KWU19266.1 hypothetical protein AS149_13420 [Burkholderia cenocepacia]SAL57866.1 hypothetical protein AWB71_03159 [Caballeronia peredens]